MLDAENLFKMLIKHSHPTKKPLLIDLKSSQESIDDKIVNHFGWCRSAHNISDALTKNDCNTALYDLLRTNMLNPKVDQLFE